MKVLIRQKDKKDIVFTSQINKLKWLKIELHILNIYDHKLSLKMALVEEVVDEKKNPVYEKKTFLKRVCMISCEW